jgi:transposase
MAGEMKAAEQEERRERIATMFRRGVAPMEIAQQYGVNAPAIYKVLRKTGDLPPYNHREARQRVSPVEPKVILSRVDRDPCPRCGTRRDIGCVHVKRECDETVHRNIAFALFAAGA